MANIDWKNNSENSYTGYYKNQPIFLLSRENELTWSVFISMFGKFYGTFEECKSWAERENQLHLANEIVSHI